MKINLNFKEYHIWVRIVIFFVAILAIIVISAFLGWMVSFIWNFVIADVFGLPAISFLQGWGLLILARILFPKHNDGENNSDNNLFP